MAVSPYHAHFPQYAPQEPRHSSGHSQQRPREESFRIYVTLRQSYESSVDYKKLILMTSPHIRIAELKRKIEKEFVDLFPAETPFVVAKLEDEYGYSLSNGSVVGDFLKHGDRIIAQPEGFVDAAGGSTPGGAAMPGKGLYGGGNTSDLLAMIQNLQ